MRALFFLMATAALLPYVLLATAFLLLDQAISAGSLPALLWTLLVRATWLIPWGALGFMLAAVALVALALHPRSRWLAGLLLSLIAVASVAILVLKQSSPAGGSESIVFVPCILVALYGAWIALDERRSRRLDRESIEASA